MARNRRRAGFQSEARELAQQALDEIPGDFDAIAIGLEAHVTDASAITTLRPAVERLAKLAEASSNPGYLTHLATLCETASRQPGCGWVAAFVPGLLGEWVPAVVARIRALPSSKRWFIVTRAELDDTRYAKFLASVGGLLPDEIFVCGFDHASVLKNFKHFTAVTTMRVLHRFRGLLREELVQFPLGDVAAINPLLSGVVQIQLVNGSASTLTCPTSSSAREFARIVSEFVLAARRRWPEISE